MGHWRMPAAIRFCTPLSIPWLTGIAATGCCPARSGGLPAACARCRRDGTASTRDRARLQVPPRGRPPSRGTAGPRRPTRARGGRHVVRITDGLQLTAAGLGCVPPDIQRSIRGWHRGAWLTFRQRSATPISSCSGIRSQPRCSRQAGGELTCITSREQRASSNWLGCGEPVLCGNSAGREVSENRI